MSSSILGYLPSTDTLGFCSDELEFRRPLDASRGLLKDSGDFTDQLALEPSHVIDIPFVSAGRVNRTRQGWRTQQFFRFLAVANAMAVERPTCPVSPHLNWDGSLKIATYNVNGIVGRLPVLLRWLKEDQPDVVCLQELKAIDANFPRKELEKAGYGAVWHGQKSWNGVAILCKGSEPRLTRKGLPGDPDDSQSRYIEAIVDGIIVGGLYLPNGNPAPGPKFDYKLQWFERLQRYAGELLELEVPAILVGDFNVMPSDLDVYKPERWRDDALFRPEVRKAYAGLVLQGWTDAIRHLHPDERIYTFWKYWRNSFERDAGLRIDHFLCSPAVAPWLISGSVRRNPRSWEHTSDHAPVIIELEPPHEGVLH